jgi:hypothetical protein
MLDRTHLQVQTLLGGKSATLPWLVAVLEMTEEAKGQDNGR